MVLGHDVAELLELEPDEVALMALPSIKLQGAVCWNNLNQGSRAEMNRDGVSDEETLRRVRLKLAAAWQWLLKEGLLAPHPGQDHPWYMATERAIAMADPHFHLSEVRSLSLLRRAQLDPALTERVLPIFRRALYSAAVFQAMLEVEVRVRDLSGLSLNGVDLMKQAFRGQPAGPLSDPSAGVGDREARMALFWGAIGEYRNEAGTTSPTRTIPRRPQKQCCWQTACFGWLRASGSDCRRRDQRASARPTSCRTSHL